VLPFIFRGHDEVEFFAHAVGMRAAENPLRLLPGNQRNDEARYACVVVVRDYIRMRLPTCVDRDWHYSDLEPAILEDVRMRRAVLVFDLSNEGPAYDAEIFDELYAWIEANRLPAGHCIWLSQNRQIGAQARAHAGARAGLIAFEPYDFFVKLMAWKFSSFDSPDYLARLFDVARKDRLLLCLNATPRLGRVLAVAALQHHKLLDFSIVSFPGMNYVKSGATMPEVLAFLDANPNLALLKPSIADVERMAPLRADVFEEQGNELVEKIDPGVYERTFFSLVTESDFLEPGIERVTEKTVKAFCMGHPTLVVGNARSIDVMRGYGFLDWSDVLDRSGDTASLPAFRFEAVMAEVLRQAERIDGDAATWLDAVRQVSIHNHRYAVSGDFLKHYIDAVDDPLVARLEALVTA